MTVKGDSAREEWARVVRGAVDGWLAVSTVDPGGPIEAAKEWMPTIRTPPTLPALCST